MKLAIKAAFCMVLMAVAARSDEAAPGDASVSGMIAFRGEVPKSTVADDAGVRRDLISVDSKTGGLKGVVVWLVPTSANVARVKQGEFQPALMDQQDHEFVPRVLAVCAGQPVRFTNSDPANHNVRTAATERTNQFNVFTGADGSYTHRFAPQPEPIRIGCDIHPWMRAWIYVFDHPFFAVTDERGRFQISRIPAGDYECHIAQPDIRYREQRRIVLQSGKTHTVESVIENDKRP